MIVSSVLPFLVTTRSLTSPYFEIEMSASVAPIVTNRALAASSRLLFLHGAALSSPASSSFAADSDFVVCANEADSKNRVNERTVRDVLKSMFYWMHVRENKGLLKYYDISRME